MDELVERTRKETSFVEHIVEEITVNTTELFRDPQIWISFYEKAYPILKEKKSISIWHAGSSSGQEIYSNLIILNELGLLEKAQVLATDINLKMIVITSYSIHYTKLYE